MPEPVIEPEPKPIPESVKKRIRMLLQLNRAAAVLYSAAEAVVDAVVGSDLRAYTTCAQAGNEVAVAHTTAERKFVLCKFVADDCKFVRRRTTPARPAAQKKV